MTEGKSSTKFDGNRPHRPSDVRPRHQFSSLRLITSITSPRCKDNSPAPLVSKSNRAITRSS